MLYRDTPRQCFRALGGGGIFLEKSNDAGTEGDISSD